MTVLKSRLIWLAMNIKMDVRGEGIMLQLSKRKLITIIATFMIVIFVASFILGLAFYSTGINAGGFLGGLGSSSEGAFPASFAVVNAPDQTAKMAAQAAAQALMYSRLETIGRMMVYTAQLSLGVNNVDLAINNIQEIALDLGGNVTGITTSKEGGRKTGVVTIRVPQGSFYTAIQAIENLGEVKSKEVKGEDVTEQYVDLSARLSNLQKQEQRLIEILEMCKTVEDVLKVEAELNQIRGEIERLIGQIRYIESRVDLATIIVLLDEPERWISMPEMSWARPIEAGLWGVFIVVQGLIALAIVAAPFIAIGTPIYYLYRRRQTKNKVTI